MPVEEAEKILGTPRQTLTMGRKSYRVYKLERRKGVVILSHPVLLIGAIAGRPWPPVMTREGPSGIQCVLLEVAGQMVHRLEASLHDEDTECPPLIESNQKIMSEFQEWISSRVAAEDYSTPFEQAIKIGKPEFLRTLAEAGDARAIVEYTAKYGPGANLPLLSAEEVRTIDIYRAYELYRELEQKHQPGTAVLAWKLRCRAANDGHGDAQERVGYWHLKGGDVHPHQSTNERVRSAGVQPDNRIAYMWYRLAAQGGVSYASYDLSRLAEILGREATDEAGQFVDDWTPGQCPTPVM